MTPKSLWNILIKLFGCLFFHQFFTLVTVFISAFIVVIQSNYMSSELLTTAFGQLLLAGVNLILASICIFKTTWVIEKLQLCKGIDQDWLDLNISLHSFLFVASVVFGCVLFLSAVPDLCIHFYSMMQQISRSSTSSASETIICKLIIDVLQLVIGYFLITENKAVVRFIERHSNIGEQQAEEKEEPSETEE